MKYITWLTAALVLVLDLWTKHLVVSHMNLYSSIELPVSFIKLTYIRNFGGAFGILQNQKYFFLAAGFLAIVFIFYIMPTLLEMGKLSCVFAGMILGGALGNLWDRLQLGYVIDFLDLGWWPIFNVADIGITVGITFLVIQTILMGFVNDNKDKSSEGSDYAELGVDDFKLVPSPPEFRHDDDMGDPL